MSNEATSEMGWDIQLGQLDVPASVLFPRDGTWLTQELPRLSQLEIEMSILHGCRLSQSEIYLDYSFDVWLSYYLMAILVTMDFSENFNYSNTSYRLICFPSSLHVKGLSS